jgi:hypothetical protein
MRLRIRAMKRHGHAFSDSSPPDFELVVHADVTPTYAGGLRCECVASAWMPGIGEWNDAVPRTAMPGNDERERTKEKNSEAKRRQTQGSSTVPHGHGRAWIARRTSIGVPPRLSSQGVFHRRGLSTRLLLPGTWRPGLACPSGGRYPPLPVPVRRPNAP